MEYSDCAHVLALVCNPRVNKHWDCHHWLLGGALLLNLSEKKESERQCRQRRRERIFITFQTATEQTKGQHWNRCEQR